MGEAMEIADVVITNNDTLADFRNKITALVE
jgi:dephospho-CoA kinase